MSETVLDVLMFLFDNYLSVEVDVSDDEDAITDELEQAGFQEGEIYKAFNWLSALSDMYRDTQLKDHLRASRILTSEERLRLDTSCQGYLVDLCDQGVLDAPTREIILESAMSIDVQTLNLSQFKRIIALVLLNNPSVEAIVTTEEDLIYEDIGGLVH